MNKLFYPLFLVALTSITLTTANEWKYGCLNTTAYKGDNTSIAPTEFGGDTRTCAEYFELWFLNKVTFNTSLTCSKLPSADAKSQLIVMGKYCCTGSTSICTGDPKYMCKDAATFTPTKTVTPTNGNADTCINHAISNSLVNMPFKDIVPWNSATQCSDFTTTSTSQTMPMSAKDQLSAIGSLCCSDRKTACYVDYSKICKDPSTYTGAKETSSFGTSVTCDWLVDHNSASSTKVLYGTNWSTIASCSDVVNTITEDGMTGQLWSKALAVECCSDKIGICADETKLNTESGGIMLTVVPKKVLFAVLIATSYMLLL